MNQFIATQSSAAAACAAVATGRRRKSGREARKVTRTIEKVTVVARVRILIPSLQTSPRKRKKKKMVKMKGQNLTFTK